MSGKNLITRYFMRIQSLDKRGEVQSFTYACKNAIFKNRHLKCRYYYGNNKYFTIGPLREESISIIPRMELYHNVLYDDEIQKLKHLAKPKVKLC